MSLWEVRHLRKGFLAFHAAPKDDGPTAPGSGGAPPLETYQELMALYGPNGSNPLPVVAM